jgi:hypothetical protein
MNARKVLGVLLQLVGWSLMVASASLAWVGVAEATIINGTNGAAIEYVSGGANIADGSGLSFQGRNWTTPSGRTVGVTDTGAPLRLGGKDININASRTILPTAINRAAAIALKGLAPVAVGLELWDLFNELRVRPGTCAEGGLPSSVSDLLCFDEGTAPEESNSTVYCLNLGSGTVCKSSLTALAGDILAAWPSGANNCPTLYSTTLTPSPSIVIRTQFQCWGSFSYPSYSPTVVTQTDTQCPASIDASDPANNIPAGLPVGEDGKCRTGRYNAPISPQAAADKLEAQAPRTGEQLKDIAQDVIERGGEIEGSEREVSGPASSPGTPSVTTAPKPGGGTITTTKTATTHYTYNNNTVNYTIVTVTTVNDGTTETTTTEGTVPEESDQCKTAPNSLGCAKMGTPGDEAPAWQVRDVVFAPEDLGFSGSCPAPESWDVFGITLTWGYEPICEIAPFIRFALLAFAGIGAISIVIRETAS